MPGNAWHCLTCPPWKGCQSIAGRTHHLLTVRQRCSLESPTDLIVGGNESWTQTSKNHRATWPSLQKDSWKSGKLVLFVFSLGIQANIQLLWSTFVPKCTLQLYSWFVMDSEWNIHQSVLLKENVNLWSTTNGIVLHKFVYEWIVIHGKGSKTVQNQN